MKTKVHYETTADFLTKKVSCSPSNDRYKFGGMGEVYIGKPDILYKQIVFVKDVKKIFTHGEWYDGNNDVPTRLSQLENDANYVKGSQIPTKVSQLNNDIGYVKSTAVPTKVSQLANDSKFVTQGEVDLSTFVTNTEFDSYKPLIEDSVNRATLATINGQPLANGGKDITLDTSLFEIIDALPTSGQKNKIYILAEVEDGKEVANQYAWTGTAWKKIGAASSKVDLSQYMTIEEAQRTFMLKSGTSQGGSTASGGAALSISTNGSFNNFGDSGQAFNAVRNLSKTNNWQGAMGSGFVINAASFGVKMDGHTAFSHKKYDTFNSETGAYTGAKNTAVLMFSGKGGLIYAKNTGTSSDVTEAMYKYVGVIDSPDAKQKVYSSAQIDGITNALAQRIEDLEGQNAYLMSVVGLLIEKMGITDEELVGVVGGIVAKQSLSDIGDDVRENIESNTIDYSSYSGEESGDEA